MMLSYQLKSAIKELEALIALSEEDIADIKQAKHNTQFERLAIKEKIKVLKTKSDDRSRN